jgi:hypothetical protein
MLLETPIPAIPANRAPRAVTGPVTLAFLMLSGVVTGLAHLDGRLWLLGWVGVAIMALGARPQASAVWVGASLLLSGAAAHWCAHPWHLDGLGRYLPGGPAEVGWWLVPFTLAWTLPQRLPLWLGWWLARRWKLPVWAWLPPSWWLGEAVWDQGVGLSHDAWLYAQWQVTPVLRAVGHLGWDLTLLVSLAVAAVFGEAVARRAWRPAAVGALAVCGLASLPTLPPGDLQVLDGVGAVHLADYAHPLRTAPNGLSAIVWPEVAGGRRPRLAEGPGRGTRIAPPLTGTGAHHLVGLVTRSEAGLHNAVVAQAPDGTVRHTRVKTRLFPLQERPFAGLTLAGAEPSVPGTGSPVVPLGDRRATALICVEALDRGLVARGRREGASLVTISSNDWGLGASPVAHQQVLAAAVFRAVEAGTPLVRSAIHGQAAFIGADGRVLALSEPGKTGVLTAAGLMPARVDVAVLIASETPELRAALPEARSRYFTIEGFENPGVQADTVVVAGHSLPPLYLGRPAGEVARAIACFAPSLVVLDTCYGASLPVLEALAETGLDAWVVGPPFRIPPAGLRYAPGFLDIASAAARAAAVRTEPPYPLMRWRLDRRTVVALRAEIAQMDAAALRRRLKVVTPPLLRMELAPGVPVLADVAAERFTVRP